eukprot:TRINITY_DN27199_c0_g1_i1.p1 TRINITY_DN27199_c0_g1~~TRINITY_DN27199_c0_g1_i1.p1  ORF type:complete len:520 (+),score=177.22 TRINITY_DN27199_c0_g1_i1:57-1562(+)
MATLMYALALVGAKSLAAYSYRSTDFEVHRNWMAVTDKLPMSEWYYNNASEWTLDYPPVFAYFERVLALGANVFDPNMTELHNLEYASDATVLYQRYTVALGDVALFFAVYSYLSRYLSHRPRCLWTMVTVVVLNPGLFIVDSIHFQYNALLYALLVFAFDCAAGQRYILCGIAFTVLLCAKHIYLYMAPAFFIYLLRRCVVDSPTPAASLVKLGSAVIATALTCLGPFLAHLPQLLSRLFPWGRGLCHAYWAPNMYALYNAADLALLKAAQLSGGEGVPACPTCVNTRGLVDTYEESAMTHHVLPSLSPKKTLVITVGAVCVITLDYWMRAPQRRRGQDTSSELVWLSALTSAAFFMFSWHVHEKAILMVSVPLTLLLHAVPDHIAAVIGNVLSVGTLTLFPLLFRVAELPLKFALSYALWVVFPKALQKQSAVPSLWHGWVDSTLCVASYAAALYASLHPYLPWGASLPFIPLMALSLVGAASLSISFARLYAYLLRKA